MQKVIALFLLTAALPPLVQAGHMAPLRVHRHSVSNEYLVTYTSDSEMDKSITPARGRVKKRFKFNRTLWTVLDSTQLEQLRTDPAVASIESNAITTLADTPNWGLDRIDQDMLPLNGSFQPLGTGAGTHAYILDTGIQSTHPEFTGRIGQSIDIVGGQTLGTDCQGHGTHVAGIVAGTTVGVAPQATLHSVRVMSCDGTGSTSSMLNGIDWILKNAIKPAVVNISITTSASDILNSSIRSLVNAGITVVVAAGNYNTSACKYSPASEPTAITVAATGSNDIRSQFSNFGNCVDIFAPGENISSASNTNNGYIAKNGTSMASPYVAGAAAVLLGRFPALTPAQVNYELMALSTPNVIFNTEGTPNRLLNIGVVEKFPIAVDVGFDQIVSRNVTLTLDGSKSIAPDDKIISYLWTQTSGPTETKMTQPEAAKTQVTGFTQSGVYQFSLQATSQSGNSNVGVIKITVNVPPTVSAGPDIKYSLKSNTLLFLNGTASDPDGSIIATKWTQISGKNKLYLGKPTNLSTFVGVKRGIYVFQLLAKDNLGATSVSQMKLTVVK